MHLSAPPDGRPWALIALCGASLTLNLVLGGALLWSAGAPSADAPSEPDSVTRAEGADPADPGAGLPESTEADLQAPVEPAPATVPDGVKVAHASVERNLAYTFQQAVGEGSDALAATTARLFVWDLDLRRDLQRGDAVQVAWTTVDDLPVILAARYRSNKLGSELTAYRYHAPGDAFPSYWSADGTEVPHVLDECPLKHTYEQITSLLKDRPTHKGMDFKTPVGTPVVTPRGGTVVRTDWNFTYNGNAVEVRWADGTLARFLHLSDTRVEPGQSLAAGAVIGLSGNTGRSTAPHLHYELEKGGKTLDPAKVHGTSRRVLPAAERAAFDQERERLDAVLATEGA